MKNIFSVDGLKSLVSGMGTDRDKRNTTNYHYTPLSDQQLISSYATSWIAKRLVDIPAEDMLRKWRTWGGDNKADLEALEKKLKIKGKLLDCKKKARLFGGAAIFIGTGQELSEPLDFSKVDNIDYLTVLNKHELHSGEIENDPLSELYGMPKYYRVAHTGVDNAQEIHPSHFVIMSGDKNIDTFSSFHCGWDISVLQASYDACKNGDSAANNIASLLFEANVDVIGVPDLTSNLSTGGATYEKNLLTRFALAAKGKGISGMLVLDKEEEYNRRSASFAQLPELLTQFTKIPGASQGIPESRFTGTSSRGLNNSGEGEMKTYYDKIQSMQELYLEPEISNLDKCLINIAGSEGDTYTWNPLEQMSEKELSEIAKTTGESLKNINDLGVLATEEMRQITINALSESGAYPNIDNVIAETKANMSMGTLEELNEE